MAKLQDIFNDDLVIDLNSLKDDRELVEQIEIRLKDLGLLQASDVNGIWGSSTEQALTRFCEIAFLPNMNTERFGRTFAKKLIEMDGPLILAKPGQAVTLNLTGSVGSGGANNPNDVLAVKNRLADLGFRILRNSSVDAETIHTIKLFQSIINGLTVIGGDGRVDVSGPTHKFLEASNAPRWLEMPPGSSNEGFLNHDNVQRDTHDFGTDWLIDNIKGAAKDYLNDYRSTHPNAALLTTNNLSVERGGKSPHHATHQTGLSCDILLPRKNGTSGGIEFTSSAYDQDAMRAMLKALRQQKHKVSQIFFNDIVLITAGLCQPLFNHDNHAHVDIIPP